MHSLARLADWPFVIAASTASVVFLAFGCSSSDSSSAASSSDSGAAPLGTCTDMAETPAQVCAAKGALCPTGDTAEAALALLCSPSPSAGAIHPIVGVSLGCHSLIVTSDVESVITYTFAADDTTLIGISAADDTDHVACYSTPGAKAATCTGASPSVSYTYDKDCAASDAGVGVDADTSHDAATRGDH